MTLKCKACGNTDEFEGVQAVSGSISVVVSGEGEWLRNVHEDSDYAMEMDLPEGPWTCRKCGSEDVEESDGDGSGEEELDK